MISWIIVGLGNPGRKYDDTKHNVGFRVADELAARRGAALKKLKFQSLCGESGGVLLLKPQTFMNLSGRAVRESAQFYRVPPEKIIVVHDDVALPPGRLRIRENGSDGGHNGLKDILYHLQSDAFIRIKIGVGGVPHPEMDLADWVLSPFPTDTAKTVAESVLLAADAAECIIKDGAEKAMNTYNAKGKG